MSQLLEQNQEGAVQATKHDRGKPMLSLFPRRAYIETCKVFTYGAHKYAIGNWHAGEGFDWQRLSDAGLRHHWDFLGGEDIDPESGYPHLAHEMCCNAMLLEHYLAHHGKDTRGQAQFFGRKQS